MLLLSEKFLCDMKKWLLFVALSLGMAGLASAAEPVRNLILMIGDGMGLSQVSMLKIENGYAPTAFDRAQGVALISTYSANNRVTDSAAAGTALASGCKTNNSALGVDPYGQPLESMMAKAHSDHRPTGIVVTCYLQHATPGAFYAHSKSRSRTAAITDDLLESGIDVLFGGGSKWLSRSCGGEGTYFDAFRSRGYLVADSLGAIPDTYTGRVLCSVADEHLPEASERGDYLPEATSRALSLLSAGAAGRDNGFLLLVEGSQIDFAGHGNDAGELLDEMRDFERAVAVAMDFADRTPGTLVVVTADHETGGLTIPACDEDFTQAENGVEYRFSTGGHTGMLVPVYLYGTGADRIRGVMDNTDLSKRLMQLLGLAE